ncbi:MAG: SET domain-containing protein [Planctomycetota bacterium]
MFDVRPSGIHGLGLFANRLIPADTVIGQLAGRPTTEDGAYVLWLDDENGLLVENDLRYINHDHAPNAAYFDDLTVAALRDIQPGEEITHNYLGDDADGDDEDIELEFGA